MRFSVTYTGDKPVYAVLRRLEDWAVYSVGTDAFVVYRVADLSDYAVVLESQSGDLYGLDNDITVSSRYNYIVNYYEKAGDDYSDTDDLLLNTETTTASGGPTIVVPDEDTGAVYDIDVIEAGIPVKDGCPVLTRINAFIVPEMTTPTLQHTIRSRDGSPIDLTDQTLLESAASDASLPSTDSASSDGLTEWVQVLAREFTGVGASDASAVFAFTGELYDPTNGVIRASLPSDLTAQSGVYTLSFGYYRDSRLRLVNQGLLSVEPNLFGVLHPAGNNLAPHREGCPTIQELRMQMWDSSSAENVLLDDVEFNDEQILLALVKPIQVFNTSLPPLGNLYNTTNFPFRSQWIDATIGYLYQFAAAFYRRNRLQGAASGVNVDDLNKEDVYMRISQKHQQEWKDFVLQKKVEINMQRCVGQLGSTYGLLRNL